MPTEILLYGQIHSRSSIDFINEVDAVENDDVVVRVNTNGGDVLYGWGMVAKFQEFTGNKTVKIDGSAFSMGLFFAAYADNVEALDVSKFLLHRAAYPQWYEADYMSESEKDNLVQINSSLEKAFRAKIDVEKFEEIKGVKLKDVFSMDDRIDVMFSAAEAKKIGLVKKINKITPAKKSAIKSDFGRIAAKYNEIDVVETPVESKQESNKNSHKKSKMNRQELNAEHPALAAELIAEGVENAKATEKDRAGAWLKFVEVDPKAVADGINSGEDLSQTATADFAMKMASAKAKTDLEAEAAKDVTTDKVDETQKTEVELTEEKLMATLNIPSAK